MTSIYVVDDHALMRDGLRVLLSAHGHEVVGDSGSADKALADILELVPEILLLDLNLGDSFGLELQELLHRHRVPTRTVVYTVAAQYHQVLEAHRLGVLGFVFKGASATTLLQSIDAVMNGRRHWEARAQTMLDSPGQRSRIALLSPREVQIVQLVVRGLSSAAIAKRLFLSPKTVDTYRSRLMAKLEVNDVPGLVRLAIREGLIGLEDG